MKRVDAVWEKQGLGLGVLELELGADDSTASVLDAVDSHKATHDYFLVKVPAGSAKVVQELEGKGFRFLETRISLCRSTEKYAAPSIYTAIASKMACAPVRDQAGLNSVLESMDAEMFIADRVSQDPVLGSAKALARYRNWVKSDFSKKGKTLYAMRLGTHQFGFFTTSVDEKASIMHVLLGGTYTSWKGKGLGLGVVHLPLSIASEAGANLIVTAASTNNPAILNFYTAFGYRIDATHYVLRLHAR